MAEVHFDTLMLREFSELNMGKDNPPDESTPLGFRRQLKQ